MAPNAEGPVELGKSPQSCKCGQEEKVVVLVGCTQHGKSSLIRSILDYGGYRDQADRVKIGNFGNSSTTQDSKEFAVRVNIKKHVLKDASGKVRTIDWTKEEPDDLYELTPSMSTTADHIHLRIIDTPGLDDSNNSKEAEKSQAHNANSAQVRVVDERHKFSVLRAIASLGRIHAVCFVLDIGSSLGMTIQGRFREYLDIFNMSKLNASFHFAHTKVDVDKLFNAKAQGRPAMVDKTFGTSGKSSHHCINNLPDDPIATHFSHLGLAALLASLKSCRAQRVKGLKYPKSDAHKYMDEVLKLTLNTQEVAWRNELARLRSQKDQWASSKRYLGTRASSEHDSWHALYRQVQDLDTKELVQVGYQQKYERAHLFGTSRLYFYVTGKSTIRKFDLDRCSDSYWSGGGPSQSDVVGSSSCGADLIGDGWNTSIQGSVTLFGWKKEAKADELAAKTSEEGEAWSDYQATKHRVSGLESDIEKAVREINALTAKSSAFKSRQECLAQDFITIETLKTNAQYFASSSIISYSKGLQLSDKLATSLALDESQVKGGNKTSFQTKETNSKAIAATSEKALARLKDNISTQEKCIESLQESLKSVEAGISSTMADLKGVKVWEASPFSASNKDAEELFRDFEAQMTSSLEHGKTAVEDALHARGEMLQQRQELLTRSLAKLKPLVEKSRSMEEVYRSKLSDLEASAAAAELVQRIMSKKEHYIGVLAALKESLRESRPDQWDDVFHQLKEVYWCDSTRWEELVRLCR